MKLHSELASGLFLLEKKTIADERGFFQRIFCPDELVDFWGNRKICQVNRSVTMNMGSFRGFHFQKPPYAEMKFIQCTKGGVLDIAIDLRADSETFLQIFSYELTAENNLAVVIPEGFAHGFQVLLPSSELIYFHSAPYKKEFEDGVNFRDPAFEVNLPLAVREVSERDKNFKFIDKFYEGIRL